MWKRVRRIWVGLGLALTVVFIGWSLIAYRATPVAHAALETDARVAKHRRIGAAVPSALLALSTPVLTEWSRVHGSESVALPRRKRLRQGRTRERFIIS